MAVVDVRDALDGIAADLQEPEDEQHPAGVEALTEHPHRVPAHPHLKYRAKSTVIGQTT